MCRFTLAWHFDIMSNMSKESSPRVNRDAPFLLRPHHIVTFRRLVVGIQATIEEDEYRGIANRARGFTEKIRKGSIANYKEDVIGTTEEDQAIHTQRLIDLATDFHHSPDSREIRIANTLERDGLCQACIQGDHCSQPSGARRSLLEVEAYFIEDFFRYVNKTPGASSKIRVERRPIEGTQVQEIVLVTDVGTLKTIFRNPFMDSRMY